MDLPGYLESIENLIKNSFTLKSDEFSYKKRKIWPNFLWNNIFTNPKNQTFAKIFCLNDFLGKKHLLHF